MKKYDVALSFAGEDRHYAEALANLLKSGGYSVFYDDYEKAQLWGKNLYDHFSSVYKDQARYCVMFLSEHYARKLWTKHERQSAQARALEESKEYILPIRLDDTEISGILGTLWYLDFHSMSIEEIYQTLVEKLVEPTSQVTPTDILNSTAADSNPSEFVLFRQSDGKQYFIPFQDAHWDSTEISLELLPESPEETAFLRSLRSNLSNRFAHEKLAFALQEDAAWVSPQSAVQITSGSQTVWKVVLKEDSGEQNFSPLGEIAYNNISPNQIAKMRAKRILLDEKLGYSNQVGYAGFTNDSLLESFIQGGTSPLYELGLQIQESPLPNLYRSFGHTPQRFQKFARLTSALYLKLSNTVEDILQLDLELLDPNQLQVHFKGHRRRHSTNVEPYIVQVNGICPLSK